MRKRAAQLYSCVPHTPPAQLVALGIPFPAGAPCTGEDFILCLQLGKRKVLTNWNPSPVPFLNAALGLHWLPKQRPSEVVVISGWHGLVWPGEGEVTVDSVLQFSKERHIMDRTPERLKKELEEELLLSSEDLRSHAWYHGRIPRQVCVLFPSGSVILMALLGPAQRSQNSSTIK